MRYPKPGPTGGRLIREVISFLRRHNVTLPITSHILIAVSGGSDSIALACLLVRYGRRVGAKIILLHINHRWRGAESDADARFVKSCAKRWKVPIITRTLKPLKGSKGISWENEARKMRKKIYLDEAKKREAVVLTAHTADDLAETLLWRIFTGAADTHGGGIAFRHGVELRPFLTVRKSDLKKFLKEEREIWREDKTNFEGRFLRSKMRLELMPVVERLFPRAVEHLVDVALQAQGRVSEGSTSLDSCWLGASGLRMRKPHWEFLDSIAGRTSGEIHLPGGWRVTRS